MRNRGIIKRVHPDLAEEIERIRRQYKESTGRDCTFVEASRLVKAPAIRFVKEDNKQKKRFIDFFG